jgi:FlaA1/EpsC-like NDP-sugar epimerase
MLAELDGTSILVVGAGGSIGSALALRLAGLAPSQLVFLEASESNLDALQQHWAREGTAVPAAFRLGRVGDRALLQEIFAAHAPDLVFHAAAFKHVPLLEGQPLAAIENNVFGTLALVDAAAGARIILLSTDKAVAPASVMGATKRVAEQIVLSAGGAALRLGNVLASRGSVAEVFAGQIAAGGPLTVTAPEASRYFLTIDEAVNLLLAAALEEPALLAPALSGPYRIVDLAHFMARELAPGRAVPIRFTGLRPGDKEAEQFLSATERSRPAEIETLLSIESPVLASDQLRSVLARLRTALDARDLAAALDRLQSLVPDYEPGLALLALAGGNFARVTA